MSFSTIPIMMVSGSFDDDEINTAFLLGACDYITKPYPRQLMLRRIKDHLIISKLND